ncbi:MAG: TPM domain-containing protein [bacterium]
MGRAFPAWILLALSLLFGTAAAAQTYPAYKDVYVDDFANLLTADQEATIREQLIGLFDKTGIQAVVVTVPTMTLYRYVGEIEPFATGLFNFWGVGDAKLNNGVMVLVARLDRQMRIELGSGYPKSMDAEMQRIIDRKMLPEFRNGHFDVGITAGVDDLVRTLEINAGVAKPMGLLEQAQHGIETSTTAALGIFAAIGLALLAGATRLYQLWRRTKPRFCPVDGSQMDLLGEEADDARLQPGQVVEERVGSMDYDVWHCAKCQQVTIESYRRWFSSYGACRTCHYRTVQGTTTTLRAATTTETGLKRIDYHCENCSAEWSVTQSIAKISDSNSSSSFGGGSSSGGGASGRW